MLDLPRETWEAVLCNLIPDHRRPLLGVNKFLRSVARRSIFQIVHIHLGAFETIHPAINDRGNASNLDRRAFIRSFEILAYISKDAAFASVVRTVVVHAYAKGRDVNDGAWRTALIKAIHSLTSLRHFNWYGTAPEIPGPVVKALAQCPVLTSIRVPPRPLSEESLAFNEMHSLESIRISWIRQVDSVIGYWLKDLKQAVDQFLPMVTSSGRAGTLRELAAYSQLFLAVPVECFRTLTRLDVWSPTDMKDVLERVIVCAPQLECLMIGCMDFDDLAEVLIANPDSLPCLYMLKVVSLDPIKDERSVQSLIDFLRNKKGMRRLDTNFPGLSRKDMGALIECYRSMKQLDMIGIDARTIAEPEEMEEFAASLPTSLVALHVQSCWENLPVDAAEFQPLIQSLAENNTIRFLHIQSPFDHQQIAVEYLRREIPSLEIIGCGDDFWEVTYTPKGDIVTRPMKRYQVVRDILLETPDATRSPDWWWLMLYHDLYDELISSVDGVTLD